MTRSVERESPEENIYRLHEFLIEFLKKAGRYYHLGLDDAVVYEHCFTEKTRSGDRPRQFNISTSFVCSQEHKSRDIPSDSIIQLGFINEFTYLAVDRENAVLEDIDDNIIKDADDKTLKYYIDCLKAVIKEPPSMAGQFSFSDS